jgi:hypothetical protein
MTQLTVPQARAYGMQAGFSGTALDTIVAIAQAESGLRTDAYNGNDPYGGSFGVLQINGAHFQNGGITKAGALDPGTAFRYAYTLYQAQGFEPWGTYDPKNGTTPAYKQYMPTGGNVATNNTNSSSGQSSGSPIPGVDGLTAIGNAFTTLTSPSTWVRVGLFGVALVFLIIGFMVVASHEGAVKSE